MIAENQKLLQIKKESLLTFITLQGFMFKKLSRKKVNTN